MKKKNKIIDEDMPIGALKQIPDFLPPPHQLATAEETVKVTLALTKSSIEFFKKQANHHHTKYQKMIRELVDRYANNFESRRILN